MLSGNRTWRDGEALGLRNIRNATSEVLQGGPDVTAEMIVQAGGGVSGIPRETFDLVVREGLRQLDLHDIDVTIPPG